MKFDFEEARFGARRGLHVGSPVGPSRLIALRRPTGDGPVWELRVLVDLGPGVRGKVLGSGLMRMPDGGEVIIDGHAVRALPSSPQAGEFAAAASEALGRLPEEHQWLVRPRTAAERYAASVADLEDEGGTIADRRESHSALWRADLARGEGVPDADIAAALARGFERQMLDLLSRRRR